MGISLFGYCYDSFVPLSSVGTATSVDVIEDDEGML